ncbi:MAG: hypothetical protein AABY22_31405 [Nanoarchaeota archaeon]
MNILARILAYILFFKLKIKSKLGSNNSQKISLSPVADSLVESLSNDIDLTNCNIRDLIEENQKLTRLVNKRKSSILCNLKYIKLFFRLKKITTKIIEKDKIIIQKQEVRIGIPNEQYYGIKMYRNNKNRLIATYKYIFGSPETVWSDDGINWVNAESGSVNDFFHSQRHYLTELINLANKL